jgi:hypothetical protein
VTGWLATGAMASKPTRRKDRGRKTKPPEEGAFVAQTIAQPAIGTDGKISGKVYVSPMVWLCSIVGAVLMVCVPAYWKYGKNFFIPSGRKMLHHTSEEWQRTLLPQKTLLFIGGHHRGGTTLLWELMAEHPSIGGFGTPFDTGSDYSEGSFLQDVMPDFGVGQEALYNGRAGGMPTGLGSYALGDEDQVHWTEKTQAHKVSEDKQRRILNQWGYFWKGAGSWDRPFWVEKTPTNAVASRYLQALMDLGIEHEHEFLAGNGLLAKGSTLPWELPRTSRTKFLFIQRHPLANALAHRAFLPHHASMNDLMANWLAVASYIAADVPLLEHAFVMKLEDLVSDPDVELSKVWDFLGVEPPQQPRAINVRPQVNRKYEQHYCDNLNDAKNGARHIAIHRILREQYGEAVRKLGYDLDEWACIGEAESKQDGSHA